MSEISYFEEARLHFLATHQHPINQFLHHLTNVIAIAAVILLFYDWRFSVIGLVLTQVLAIGGHIVFEKNEPAFKKYPGIVILVSLGWSFQNWFGLRQVLLHFKSKKLDMSKH